MMRLAWTVLLVSTLGFAGSAIAQGQPEPSTGAAAGNAADGPAAAPGETPSGGKTKFFAGGGLGSGSAKYKVNGKTITFDDRLQGADDKTPLVAVNVLSVGVQVVPKLFLGFDATGSMQVGSVAGNGTALSLYNYMGTATYFPFESVLFLRAGAGLSTFGIATSSPKTNERSTGFGYLLGAGVAVPLGGPHHLTLTFEQTWQSYSGSSTTKPESSQAGFWFLGYMWKN